MTPAEKLLILRGYIGLLRKARSGEEVIRLCDEALAKTSLKVAPRPGRLARGKYETHNELIRWALFYYFKTDQNQTQVAKTCKTSQATVSMIINTYGKEKDKWI